VSRHALLAWLLTGIAMLAVVAAIAYLVLIALALAVIAPEINTWPLFALLIIGLVAAATGFVLGEKRPRRPAVVVSSVLAFVANTGLLALVCSPLVTATEERYLIPEGSMGNVTIVFELNRANEVLTTRGSITYHIPTTRPRTELIAL
jgi:hypothetical protein